MEELTPKIIAILRKYMSQPATLVGGSMTLRDLGIDPLDLQMVSLDIEEIFDVQIPYDDEIENIATVDGLVASVVASIEAQALQRRMRAAQPRVKRSWVSNDAR